MFTNLSCGENFTEITKIELSRCGIEIVPFVKPEGMIFIGEDDNEVMGKIANFKFFRGWHYYIVHGDLPLSFAEKLKKDFILGTDLSFENVLENNKFVKRCQIDSELGLYLFAKELKEYLRR